MSDDAWDYFSRDPEYSGVLRDRLASGLEMDSALALGAHLDRICRGDLGIGDFGAGPGHYYPVLKRHYSHGALRYLGIDIDAININYGAKHFKDDPSAEFRVGSVLEPDACVPEDVNCIISANTLPHVPTIEPLLKLLASRQHVRWFVFRMLVGAECVHIKKHLLEYDFTQMFEQNFQLNNIYSLAYIQHVIGPSWQVMVEPDVFDRARLEQHRIPAQVTDPFYAHRVSRPVGDMVFKGDVYMPWKFVVGTRV